MNQLRHAASPYLRQHADNPVDWRQWTPETLAEAKRLGKPILLSVGYAACHWCHVMAHESFEDPATAEVMNALFVNIKVDREERPDVDHIYMSALHTLGQRGGWPLTMFLTPEAQPFWGGTYFPKVARYGQPAFVDVLRGVERTFREKPSDIANNTKVILARLGTAAQRSDAPTVSPQEMNELTSNVCDYMDAEHGGLQGAPKFPNPQVLEFLWRGAERTGAARPRQLVLRSLERMSQGGIYDHLGGGFARYSVDDRWLVPHFEKMLYDNAQLLELLALAAIARDTPETLKALFRARAQETVGWVAREMTDAGGGFCASLDADSDGVEGKFYVWTRDEIDAVLGPDDGAMFARFYDVQADGNWQDPHGGPPVTILNRLDTPAPTHEDSLRLERLRAHLLIHRAARVRPGLDDKLLADWNGLMIASLVHAGRCLGHHEWISMGARAYDSILTTMSTREAGRLRLAHSRRGDSLVRPAFALDYATMARAALALAEATGPAAGRDYLAEATDLMDTLLALHLDDGLLAMAARDADDVILRLTPTQDDAIPNAHPVALEALIRLAHLTGDTRWQEEADRLFARLAPAIQANFVGHVGVLNALDLRTRGRTIVLAGPHRAALREIALSAPWSTTSIIDLDGKPRLPEEHPATAQARLAGEAAAFICEGSTCSLPITEADALRSALAV